MVVLQPYFFIVIKYLEFVIGIIIFVFGQFYFEIKD